jgi:hypothetical protein
MTDRELAAIKEVLGRNCGLSKEAWPPILRAI